MPSKTFKLTLQSDVIITSDSATQGEHESLDFIPGSVIRGVVINNLRDIFKPELFFSGKIRFNNAYPMTKDGFIALPTPLSYHSVKNQSKKDIFNKVFEFSKEMGQFEQLRENYICEKMRHFEQPHDNTPVYDEIVIGSSYHMKTALPRKEINEYNNRKDKNDGQLFGYKSIKSGNVFCYSIDFDEDINNDEIEKITNCLKGNIHIGKSRSAEYGLALSEQIIDVKQNEIGTPPQETTILYLASDLYLEENGIPITRLKPEHFGLTADCEIDWDHSFVRYRKYSPWNSFWKGRMRERQVINKGSVITIKKKLNSNELNNRLKKGLGLFREEGLGRILVNPNFLCHNKLKLEKNSNILSNNNLYNSFEKADSDKYLKDLLKDKYENQKINTQSKEIGEKWANTLIKHWYNRFNLESLPQKSQWSQIREISSTFQVNNIQTLEEALNNYCNENNKSRDKIWRNNETEAIIGKKYFTLFDYIIKQIKIDNQKLAAKALIVVSKIICNHIDEIRRNSND